MAVVTGPLHSDSASGTFAKQVTFSRNVSTTAFKRFRRRVFAPSAAQVGIRAMNSFLTKLWASLTTEEKASWTLSALETNVMPYNAFFSFNMQRWTANLAPLKSFLVPPSGAYSPTLSLSATGGQGRSRISVSPIVLPSTRLVVSSLEDPIPDCMGLYDAFDVFDGYVSFRRRAEPHCRLFFSSDFGYFVLNFFDSFFPDDLYWRNSSSMSGDYFPRFGAEGYPYVLDEVPGGFGDPASAVAIFRDSEPITAPNRRHCRAVLPLDASGCVDWTDINQVGLKPAPPGGFPAGSYHYAAVPLSLDGRMGSLTADAVAEVTPF